MNQQTPQDRRQCLRFNIETEVTLLVLFPEETFTPHPMRGVTKDLSLSGMRVVTYQTNDTFYRHVIKSVRYAKASLILPGTSEEITLHGRIVWVDFDTKQTPPACSYGIAFEKVGAREFEALRRSLQYVDSRKVNPIQPAAVIRRPGGDR